MKKLSFLLGSLGGVMAGYVFSNKKLRHELMEVKDPKIAAKILGKHLAADGQNVAKEVRQLAEEHHLDKKVAQGTKYVKGYYNNAQHEVKKFLSDKVKGAKGEVMKAKKKVHTAAKKVEKATK